MSEDNGRADDDEIEGRASRLKAVFPGAYHQDGALVSFDMAAIKKAIGYIDPVETRSGISFQRQGGRIWALLQTRVGNVTGSWSWQITDEEWDLIVAGMEQGRAAERMGRA